MRDEGPAPPAVGVNVKITEIPAFQATRSCAAIKKVTEETALIEPEAIMLEIL